ncbi:tRNA lysidine(34) synthetase TilS [Vibrio sp. SM6]|uniref:tRNA(Ile)-lysidine synthase n=1 Tax=Vibrio agarilyticus TaxID=2726741 RepID=A0A7X8TR04_9VIBR|nr:tRNA lysidine(34) synthetase TilS [Vibrio agarilyticus]NLS13170.1 tRNA lysidine(34) synthetase TilS [Vibrio agarilyticus]
MTATPRFSIELDALYRRFCQDLEQALPSGQWVVALSGGLDSQLLLYFSNRYCKAHNKSLIAVHVHHGLSDNADAWAQACAQRCQTLGVECVIERVSLSGSGGIEQQARRARYLALEKHIQRGDTLLTGQHGDDQLETVLLALKRGSGPRGLAAMGQFTAFGQGHLLRPLLKFTRAELEFAANELNLAWVEDESNDDIRFERNYLRHEVIPPLRQRWPNIAQAVTRSAELCAEQEQLLMTLMRPRLDAIMSRDNALSIAQLQQESMAARHYLLRLWLDENGVLMPTYAQLQAMWQDVAMAQEDANPVFQLGSGQIRRFSGHLYFVTQTQSLAFWHQPLTLGQTTILPDGVGSLTLGGDLLDAIPTLQACDWSASLRLPQQGESWQIVFEPQGRMAHPEGRVGSRKLKKLFQEYHVPSWLRRRIPIVLCNEKVVAVAGLFVDRDFSGSDCALIWRKSSKFVPDS